MSAPLTDLRVLEHTGTLAGNFAGFLLRELGATVIRTDRSATTRPPGDHVLHRAKHILPTDAPQLTALTQAADVLLHDEHAPWLPPLPNAIDCAVSAWGPAAPQPPLPPDDPLVASAAGVFSSQWSWSKRPVWLVTPMVSYMTGILAALGVTAAAYVRRRGGPGQRVAVSGLQAAFALNTGTYVTGATHTGSLLDLGEPHGATPTYSVYQTTDGWVFVGALTDAFWVKLATLLDRLDLLADERLQNGPMSFGARAIRTFVRAQLEPIFRTRTTADWVAAMRAADIPCGPVGSRAAFLKDPEALALGLPVAIDDPVLGPTWQPPGPAEFSDTPLPPPTATPLDPLPTWHPRAGTPTTTPTTCFAGLRVLDITSFIAGPVCPMLLADLGADVLKIEGPEGDPFRYVSFGFVGWNRGKRSLVLDLHRPEAQAVFRDLTRRADIVVDNVRPGVLDRLGIGWDVLHAQNPRLIHLSITGFGSDGPLAGLPGFDPVFQSRSGLMHAQGGDDDPVFHTIPYNDYCAGALGALAVSAALVARETTGRGQRVNVSLFRTAFVDQAAEMILCADMPPPVKGGRDFLGPSAAQRLYHCTDGWLCVSARTETERAGLAAIAGEPVAADAPAEGPAGWAIAAWCGARTRADALGHLSALGVPVAPCVAFAELWNDPLLRASGMIAECHDPVLGTVRYGGPLVTLERTPAVSGRSAPALGADAASILGELGYSPDRIAALMDAGSVGRPR